jgi:hypothetical protein
MTGRAVPGEQRAGHTLEHVAPCGLYRGVCRIPAATQENDLAYLFSILGEVANVGRFC